MNLEKLFTVTMIGGDRMANLSRFRGAKVLDKIDIQFEIETLSDFSHLP